MKFWLSLALCLLVGVGLAEARGPRRHPIPIGPSTNNVAFRPFTALHTYFMSATGSDANSGLDAAHPWATPNHAVVCGDVIIAAAGNYAAPDVTTTPTSCPSTLGGIDGTGGIWFAIVLCGGADLEACKSTGLWDITGNNWSIQGFKATNSGGSGSAQRAFNSDGCGGVVHHHAFVNNVTFSVSSGFHVDDCGLGTGGFGADYWAVVGSAAQNSARNTDFPEAAIDDVGPGTFDNIAGTHAFVYSNFTWNNTAPSQTPFDTEDIMFDSWDARPYSHTGIIANNVGWRGWRYCIQLIPTGAVTDSPVMRWYNNTCFGNNQSTGGDSDDGELNIALGKPWSVTITDNIAMATSATSPGGGGVIDAAVNGGGANPGTVLGSSGHENILFGGTNVCAAYNGNTCGTNFLTNPSFTNTADLLANHMGVPTCTGFINVAQCMGYNAATSQLTTPSVISDLHAGCAQCVGKGFQLPSTTCVTPSTPGFGGRIAADFPTWLKGIVYLHVTSGSTIVQRLDGVTLPCGL